MPDNTPAEIAESWGIPWPAIKALLDEWEGENCAACGAAKWARYPFCRSCSIRLQRIGLMRRLKIFGGRRFMDLFHMRLGLKFVRLYDLCRDYLIASKQEREECQSR
jgi:hypothetical protein